MTADGRARQAVTVLAVASLFVGVHAALGQSSRGPLIETLFLATGVAVILGLAAAALCTTNPKRLAVIDVLTLGVGLALALVQFVGVTSTVILGGTDETLLNRLAMTTLLHGHDPYTDVYGLVGADGYGTPLLSGGQADTYGYPPLSLEIGRVLGFIAPRLAAPGVVGAIALTVLALASFFALPQSWRAVAIVTVFGFGFVTPAAIAGLPVVLSVALLCGPLWRWTATGAGGRLGRTGVAQAVLLGLAASAQQLSWFLAVFLVISVLLVRRGELGTPRALAVVGRYCAIAVGTFAAVNAPFIFADASAWAHAMASTLVQKAIVDGSSWALPAIEANGGTSTLTVLSYAAVLLLVGVLVVYSTGFRIFAPALAVVPSIVFLLSSRSNSEYFYSFLPIWLVAAATIDRSALAVSRPVAVPRPLRRVARTWPGRTALGLVVILPAVVVFLLGVTGRPPMTMRPVAATLNGTTMQTITIAVTNNTADRIAPQYFIDLRTAITHPWVPEHGPTVLAPHQRVVLVLHPRTRLESAQVTAGLWVISTTDAPAGMAAQQIRLRPAQVTVRGDSGGSTEARTRRACLARLLSGRNFDCNSQLGLTSVG